MAVRSYCSNDERGAWTALIGSVFLLSAVFIFFSQRNG